MNLSKRKKFDFATANSLVSWRFFLSESERMIENIYDYSFA